MGSLYGRGANPARSRRAFSSSLRSLLDGEDESSDIIGAVSYDLSVTAAEAEEDFFAIWVGPRVVSLFRPRSSDTLRRQDQQRRAGRALLICTAESAFCSVSAHFPTASRRCARELRRLRAIKAVVSRAATGRRPHAYGVTVGQLLGALARQPSLIRPPRGTPPGGLLDLREPSGRSGAASSRTAPCLARC